MSSRSAVVLSVLRERLRSAGFDTAGLRHLLSISYPDDIGLLNRAAAVERMRQEKDPAAILVRLFYLEDDVPLRQLRPLLARAEIADLMQAGLLARRGAQAVARLRIDPVGNLHLLADRRFRQPDRKALGLPAGDMVYPPGSDSVMLADIVSPRPGGQVLDLCTGSGIQAFSVAADSHHVTCVDIGPRAVAMVDANAALNGCTNFTSLCGDLFAPVRQRRFDLIVANPPFVPSPKRGPAYHSGGPRGDRVLRRIVERMGEHLAPGGRVFVISHLALREGEDVAAACGPWLAKFPGRVLVLVLESGSPVDLAAAQSLFALDRGLAAYGAEIRRWVAYLRRQRIEQVILLLLVAERGEARGLEVTEAFQRTLPLPLSRPPRDLVARWLEA